MPSLKHSFQLTVKCLLKLTRRSCAPDALIHLIIINIKTIGRCVLVEFKNITMFPKPTTKSWLFSGTLTCSTSRFPNHQFNSAASPNRPVIWLSSKSKGPLKAQTRRAAVSVTNDSELMKSIWTYYAAICCTQNALRSGWSSWSHAKFASTTSKIQKPIAQSVQTASNVRCDWILFFTLIFFYQFCLIELNFK